MAKSLLDFLKQPFPKPTTRYPNQEGMTPLSGEEGIKAILKQLPIAAHPDPYGNDGFSADKYKAFDREANRFGKNYSAKNDYNNQTPDFPLQNPILNVNTERPSGKAFEAVDSVGMGVKVHYRVLDKLTGNYVTRQIEQEQAEQIAADLNHEYEVLLAENDVLDELSNKTLGSYIKKRGRQLSQSNDFEGHKKSISGIKTASNKMIGTGDAASRPRKEDVNEDEGDGSVNKPKDTKPVKIKTPQVPAMKGMTPLGISPKKLKEIFGIYEVAPPGREKQVKELKKKFPGDKAAAFKIAWSSYDKSKKK